MQLPKQAKKELGLLGIHTWMHSEIKKGELKSPQFLITVNDNIYHSILTNLNIKKYDKI